MYLINRYTLNLPVLYAKYISIKKTLPSYYVLSICPVFSFFTLSSCVLSGYFLLFHFHPSLTLEIRVSGYP